MDAGDVGGPFHLQELDVLLRQEADLRPAAVEEHWILTQRLLHLRQTVTRQQPPVTGGSNGVLGHCPPANAQQHRRGQYTPSHVSG